MLDARIRRYSQSDANDVYAMLQNAEELHVAGLTYSEKAIQSWHVTRAEDVLLVAQAAENIVGFIAVKLNDPEPGAAYIDCVVVKPKHRGRGIGKQLLEQCVSSLKARGVFFVNLHVRQDFPRAVNFWDENGFKGKQHLLWMYKEI
jgi:ribosomal protein S18 acetylase RimI-like enzyme